MLRINILKRFVLFEKIVRVYEEICFVNIHLCFQIMFLRAI